MNLNILTLEHHVKGYRQRAPARDDYPSFAAQRGFGQRSSI
ncbi:hypothetical protein [Sorangium sp. So ce426]